MLNNLKVDQLARELAKMSVIELVKKDETTKKK